MEFNKKISKLRELQNKVKAERISDQIQDVLNREQQEKSEQKKELRYKILIWDYLALYIIENKEHISDANVLLNFIPSLNKSTLYDEYQTLDEKSREKKPKFLKGAADFYQDIFPKDADDYVRFLSNDPKNLSKDFIFLLPDFIYFISKTFGSVISKFVDDKKKFDQNELLNKWEENIKLMPKILIKYFTDENYKNKRFQDLLEFIYKHPNLYQITQFYEDKLPDEFTNGKKIFGECDDAFVGKLMNKLLNTSNDTNDQTSSQNSTESKSQDINIPILCDLLEMCDLLPNLPKDFKGNDGELDVFFKEFLVERGDLESLEERRSLYLQISDWLKSVHLKELEMPKTRKVLKKYSDQIDDNSHIETYKIVRKILHFNYVKNALDETIKNQGKSADYLVKNVGDFIADPSKLKAIYDECIKNEVVFSSGSSKKTNDLDERFNNAKSFLALNLTRYLTFDQFCNERKDINILNGVYMCNFFTKRNISEANNNNNNNDNNNNDNNNNDNNNNDNNNDDNNNDDDNNNNNDNNNNDNNFSDNNNDDDKRDDNFIMNDDDDESYFSNNDDDASDDDNDNDDNNNDNNNNDNNDNDNNNNNNNDNYLREINDNLSLSSTKNTNPLQKVIDIYSALQKANQFIDSCLEDKQKKGKNRLKKTKDIKFEIFDAFFIEKFVSSIVFIFDYYFLLFDNENPMKYQFLQIYNYIMQYHSNNEMHFGIVSSEDDLYRHLLFTRKKVNMLFFGKNTINGNKNKVLIEVLSHLPFITNTEKETDLYPLENFVVSSKEMTISFFRNSTWYICSIILFNSVKEFISENKSDVKTNKYEAAILVTNNQSSKTIDEIKALLSLKIDSATKHIICPEELFYNFYNEYNDKAFVHKYFDITKVVK